MQPALVEALRRPSISSRDLLGEPRADRRRLARRVGLGPQRQRLDRVDVAEKQRLQRLALGAARAASRPASAASSAGKQRRVERGARPPRVSTGSGTSSTPRSASRPSARGRRHAELLLQPLRQAGDVLQEGFVDDRLGVQAPAAR